MTFFRMTILGILMLLMAGCNQQGFDIAVSYPQLNGLEKGDRVVLEDQTVGKVTDINRLDSGEFLVKISVSDSLKGMITDRARFILVDDPDKEGKKSIRLKLVEGGQALEQGAMVKGEIPALAVQGLFNDLERGFDELASQLKGFVESLQKIPESEEYQRLKRELEKLAREMKRAGEETREKLQKEVIPKLEQELERLKEELRKLGREKEAEPLEQELDNLRRI